MQTIELEIVAVKEARNSESEDSRKELNEHKLILKEALWAMSNLAASPPFILDEILKDQSLESIIKIAQSTRFNDVFTESLFFLSNLVSNSTKSQFHQRLLNRDLLILFLKVLQSPHDYGNRLLINTLEALEVFFKYDRAMALEAEGSIRDYFEATGGIEALSSLQMHMNSHIQDRVNDMLAMFF
jgi:hypothetical protein